MTGTEWERESWSGMGNDSNPSGRERELEWDGMWNDSNPSGRERELEWDGE